MRLSAIGFVAPLVLVAVARTGTLGALDDPVSGRAFELALGVCFPMPSDETLAEGDEKGDKIYGVLTDDPRALDCMLKLLPPAERSRLASALLCVDTGPARQHGATRLVEPALTARCDVLRDRVVARFERGMRACKEKETMHRGRVDSPCFQKVRAKFDAASGKATAHRWCRRETPTGIIMDVWEPPTPRCDEVPSGFIGLCFPSE